MTVQELNTIVGNNIKHYRKKSRLSQVELAKKIGIDDQSIHRWECGINFASNKNLIMLTSILEIEIWKLFMEGKYESE